VGLERAWLYARGKTCAARAFAHPTAQTRFDFIESAVGQAIDVRAGKDDKPA
jgi:hypothetical protein